MKDLDKLSNPFNDDKVIASCGLFGMMNLNGNTFSGRDIMKAIANMHVRGNGLGGGLAVYGIYPDHKDMYALHIMFDSRRGKELTESFLKETFYMAFDEEIPHRSDVPGVDNPPVVWRYFVRPAGSVEEGKEDFGIQTPESILNTLNNILMVIQGVLVGIAAISLLVGGIGIMNTMYTSVHERTKEIGIMKALGAKNRNILLVFMIESGLLGLFGGIIGVSLGFGIAKLVEYVAFRYYESVLIQAQFSPMLLIGMLLFGFGVGAISGMFPARQAAKLKPVDALRK